MLVAEDAAAGRERRVGVKAPALAQVGGAVCALPRVPEQPQLVGVDQDVRFRRAVDRGHGGLEGADQDRGVRAQLGVDNPARDRGGDDGKGLGDGGGLAGRHRLDLCRQRAGGLNGDAELRLPAGQPAFVAARLGAPDQLAQAGCLEGRCAAVRIGVARGAGVAVAAGQRQRPAGGAVRGGGRDLGRVAGVAGIGERPQPAALEHGAAGRRVDCRARAGRADVRARRRSGRVGPETSKDAIRRGHRRTHPG